MFGIRRDEPVPTDHPLAECLAQARQYISQSDYSTATQWLDTASKMEPKQPEILADLAEAYSETGNFPQAIRTAVQAMNLDPGCIKAKAVLDTVRLKLKGIEPLPDSLVKPEASKGSTA